MNEKEYTELAVRVQEITDRAKSNEHKLNEHENIMRDIQKKQDAIYELTSSVKSIATDMTHIKEDVKEVKTGQEKLNDKVNILEHKRAEETQKRWDGIYDKLLWLFIGGIVTYLFYLATGINL